MFTVRSVVESWANLHHNRLSVQRVSKFEDTLCYVTLRCGAEAPLTQNDIMFLLLDSPLRALGQELTGKYGTLNKAL